MPVVGFHISTATLQQLHLPMDHFLSNSQIIIRIQIDNDLDT